MDEEEVTFEEEYDETTYESDTEELNDITYIPSTEIPDSVDFYKGQIRNIVSKK